MEQNVRRRPGRPRTFEREKVIARAMQLFWNEGADASLDAVSAATGLHKPSLYAAFGDKRGLYLDALRAYVTEARSKISEVLAREPLRDALEGFFELDLETFCGRERTRGCFLMGTAIDAAKGDPHVARLVAEVFTNMRAAMRDRVERAVAAADLPTGTDVELMTDLIASTHIALSVEARAGRTRGELDQKVRRLVDFVAPLG